MKNPSLSIIIPTKDRPDLLRACLQSIELSLKAFKKAYANECIYTEIIVCDNSTGTNTEAILKQTFPAILYLKGPQKGPAANRNKGASLSTGEWLVFIDDDCIASPDWLIALYKNFPYHQALEGCIVADGPLRDLWKCPINERGGNFWSANIAIKKDLFLQVGGFDTFFPYPAYEDTDLYLRLKQKTQIPFIKEAIVVHPVLHFSLKTALKKEQRVLESRAYLLAKHSQGESLEGCLSIVLREYYIYVRQVCTSLQQKLWKSTLLNLILLLAFLPCLISSFFKYRKLWGKN